VTTLMSGGYGKQITDTIEIHCNTIRTVKEVFETPIGVASFLPAEKFQTA
jgi:hypothetical protein